MNPALLSTILFAAEQLLKEAPHLYAGLAAIFSKPDVTLEDLQKLRADILNERYEDFVPATQLKDQATPPPPAGLPVTVVEDPPKTPSLSNVSNEASNTQSLSDE